MTPKPNVRSGPVLTTVKVVLVLIAIVGVGLMVLMLIGLVVGPRPLPSPDRIAAECAARFAGRGQAAIETCTVELLARAAEEERKRLLDDAYRASRTPD